MTDEKKIRPRFRSTRGANLVEYLMLTGAVGLACIIGLRIYGYKIRQKADNQASAIHRHVENGIPKGDSIIPGAP